MSNVTLTPPFANAIMNGTRDLLFSLKMIRRIPPNRAIRKNENNTILSPNL